MKVTSVRYGRTIQLGLFGGNRPCERVTFGFEADLEEGESSGLALASMRRMADEVERQEALDFADRHWIDPAKVLPKERQSFFEERQRVLSKTSLGKALDNETKTE
jgi:hypothetical protein